MTTSHGTFLQLVSDSEKVFNLIIINVIESGISLHAATKIHLKMGCQDHYDDLYCDITLCLAININLIALCEIGPKI